MSLTHRHKQRWAGRSFPSRSYRRTDRSHRWVRSEQDQTTTNDEMKASHPKLSTTTTTTTTITTTSRVWKRPAAPPKTIDSIRISEKKETAFAKDDVLKNKTGNEIPRSTNRPPFLKNNENQTTKGDDDTNSEVSRENKVLRRSGFNKLVSKSRERETRPHKRPLPVHKNPDGPKRVKLSATNDTESRATLTTFAYRETFQKRGRRPNNNNMGLVRVQPNASTTPICPLFLRGMTCTRPTCMKRHDIPREATMPICHFFQRNGQCLKRDTCPFRHIKVNPHATICPSFSLLGFCEDKDCVMKHVRPQNQPKA